MPHTKQCNGVAESKMAGVAESDVTVLLRMNGFTHKTASSPTLSPLPIHVLAEKAMQTSRTNIYETEFEVAPEKTKLTSQDWDELEADDNLILARVLPPPKDRWRLVFLIMLFYGLSTLMPWNMFITAKAYFEDFKLSVNGSVAEYRDFFMNYLGITSQFPNFLMNVLNIVCHCGSSRSDRSLPRMLWSIGVVTAMFVLTTILAIVDSTTWPTEFFWVTMIVVVVINSASGVFQNCVYGLAAKLPMKYMNAVVIGSNLSGTVAAIIGIISIAASPNLRIAAIYYFICAVVILVMAFDCYFILPLTKFYRYYQSRATADSSEMREIIKSTPSYFSVFRQIWLQLFNVWFIFFVTLGLFPAIQAAIRPLDPDFPVPDMYWAPVFCFLSFNLMAMLGNMTTNYVKFPNYRFLWIPIVMRAAFFVPFFMLCNYRPDIRDLTRFPIIVNSDWIYIVGSAVNAFLSGYLSSLCMMYAPKLVEPSKSGMAGMMMSCALCLGVFTGTLFSLALAKIFTEFGSLPVS